MITISDGATLFGTLADAEKILSECIARNHAIEFFDENGDVVGLFIPKQKPLPPEPLIPWDPSITREDIERIRSEPFLTFEEMKKKLGWE